MKIKYKNDLIAIAFLLLLTTIFFWKVILRPDEIIYSSHSDLISLGYPNYNFVINHILKTGDIPFWNPYISCGTPLIGNPNFALFYPLNILYFIMPIHLAFGYSYLLHIFLGGMFIYLFMRYLKVDRTGSFISSLILMFCGFTIARTYAGHLSLIIALTWIPLIFLLFKISLDKRSWFYGLLTGIPIGIQFLGAHIQLSYYILLALGSYFLFRILLIITQERNYKLSIKFSLIFILVVVIGFLLSAIQLIPCLEYSRYIGRSGGTNYVFATSYSFPLQNLITFLLPNFFGYPENNTYWGKWNYWELATYIGILPLILVLMAIYFKRDNYDVLFFTGVAFFSLLLALGKNVPVYWLMWKFVPGFDMFRCPARFLFLLAFSASILAGFGFNFLKEDLTTRIRRIWDIIVILTMLIVFIVLLVCYTCVGDWIYSKPYSIIIKNLMVLLVLFASSVVLLILRIKNKIQVKYFNFIAILIVLFDLWFYHLPLIDTRKLQEVYHEPDYVRFLKKDLGNYRVYDWDKYKITLNFQMVYKIQTIDGYEGSEINLKDYTKFIHILNFSKLNLLNVKYILTSWPLNHSGVKLVFKQNNTYLYENEQVLPKAFVIQNDKKIKKVEVKKYSPNEIILETNITQPGRLILSEIYYPNWKAYIDGKQQTINKAFNIFRSVYLPEGNHIIKFKYEPLSFQIGMFVTILTILGIIISLWYQIKVRLQVSGIRYFGSRYSAFGVRKKSEYQPPNSDYR